MDDNRIKLYLAALFHDIGWFYKTDELDIGKLEPLSSFIHLADSLAGGMDIRQSPTAESKDSGMKIQPLNPLFSHILLNNLIRSAEKHGYGKDELTTLHNSVKQFKFNFGYEIHPLSLSEDALFPKEIEQLEIEKGYSELQGKFGEELNKCPKANNLVFSRNIFYLFKKYLCNIPVSPSQNHIPLFEYIKIRAAFAICLYDYYIENKGHFMVSAGNLQMTIKEENISPFLLYCGNLSGIQDYIYNTYSKGARKSLKGRSFYLELLTKTLVHHILNKLELFAANEIYSGGGKFYLLLPNTKGNREKLDAIETEVQKALSIENTGDIYVCLDYIEFGFKRKEGKIEIFSKDSDGNDIKDIGMLWWTLNEKTARKKHQKYSKIITGSSFNDFFIPKPERFPYEIEYCSVTGEPCERKEENKIEDDAYVLPEVKRQTELGEKLKDGKYIVIGPVSGYNSINADIVPLSLGWGVWVLQDESSFASISSLPGFTIFTNNNPSQDFSVDFLKYAQPNHNCTYGYWLYGGNRGNDKTFEELCEADKDHSFTRLGVLRMDVDNLGNIFKYGLETKESFSAYSALSVLYSNFFCGFINSLREQDIFKDNIQIIYSGGDDLFVVGKWDKTIRFAKHVQEGYAAYTLSGKFKSFIKKYSPESYKEWINQYDDFGISGGIELVNVKYPIQRGAEKAAVAEANAKEFNNRRKNAITLLGITVSWDEEFDYLLQWKKEIYKHLNNGTISKGLLHKILSYYTASLNSGLSWQWNMEYIFARNENDSNREFLHKLKKEFICGGMSDNGIRIGNKRSQNLISLAARLAELQYRNKVTEYAKV